MKNTHHQDIVDARKCVLHEKISSANNHDHLFSRENEQTNKKKKKTKIEF